MNNHMSLTMLGTGSPRIDIERSGPAQVLSIEDKHILIDSGEGTVRQLLNAGISPREVNYLFLTHLHSDHLFGYAYFLIGGWGLGRKDLTVIGPKGTKEYHNTILKMYERDIEYRLSLGFPGNGLLDVNVIELEDDATGEIIVNPGLPIKVKTLPVNHNVTTFAYRFEYGQESVVISGDTTPIDELIPFSNEADILVFDACLVPNETYQNPKEEFRKKIWKHLQDEHSSPVQAAKIAQKANVKKLVLTHFLPNADVEIAYRDAKAVFSGDVIVGEDLQKIDSKIVRESLT